MDDFERHLDSELAKLLDPIVNQHPPRRRRARRSNPLKAVIGGLAIHPAEMSVLGETLPVAIPVPVGRIS